MHFFFSGSCDTDTPSKFFHFKAKCGNCKDGIHFIIMYLIKAKRRRLKYGLYHKWFALLCGFCKKVQVLVTVQRFLMWWGGMALSFLVSLTVSVWWCLSDVYTCHWMPLFGGSPCGLPLFFFWEIGMFWKKEGLRSYKLWVACLSFDSMINHTYHLNHADI